MKISNTCTIFWLLFCILSGVLSKAREDDAFRIKEADDKKRSNEMDTANEEDMVPFQMEALKLLFSKNKAKDTITKKRKKTTTTTTTSTSSSSTIGSTIDALCVNNVSTTTDGSTASTTAAKSTRKKKATSSSTVGSSSTTTSSVDSTSTTTNKTTAAVDVLADCNDMNSDSNSNVTTVVSSSLCECPSSLASTKSSTSNNKKTTQNPTTTPVPTKKVKKKVTTDEAVLPHKNNGWKKIRRLLKNHGSKPPKPSEDETANSMDDNSSGKNSKDSKPDEENIKEDVSMLPNTRSFQSNKGELKYERKMERGVTKGMKGGENPEDIEQNIDSFTDSDTRKASNKNFENRYEKATLSYGEEKFSRSPQNFPGKNNKKKVYYSESRLRNNINNEMDNSKNKNDINSKNFSGLESSGQERERNSMNEVENQRDTKPKYGVSKQVRSEKETKNEAMLGDDNYEGTPIPQKKINEREFRENENFLKIPNSYNKKSLCVIGKNSSQRQDRGRQDESGGISGGDNYEGTQISEKKSDEREFQDDENFTRSPNSYKRKSLDVNKNNSDQKHLSNRQNEREVMPGSDNFEQTQIPEKKSKEKEFQDENFTRSLNSYNRKSQRVNSKNIGQREDKDRQNESEVMPVNNNFERKQISEKKSNEREFQDKENFTRRTYSYKRKNSGINANNIGQKQDKYKQKDSEVIPGGDNFERTQTPEKKSIEREFQDDDNFNSYHRKSPSDNTKSNDEREDRGRQNDREMQFDGNSYEGTNAPEKKSNEIEFEDDENFTKMAAGFNRKSLGVKAKSIGHRQGSNRQNENTDEQETLEENRNESPASSYLNSPRMNSQRNPWKDVEFHKEAKGNKNSKYKLAGLNDIPAKDVQPLNRFEQQDNIETRIYKPQKGRINGEKNHFQFKNDPDVQQNTDYNQLLNNFDIEINTEPLDEVGTFKAHHKSEFNPAENEEDFTENLNFEEGIETSGLSRDEVIQNNYKRVTLRSRFKDTSGKEYNDDSNIQSEDQNVDNRQSKNIEGSEKLYKLRNKNIFGIPEHDSIESSKDDKLPERKIKTGLNLMNRAEEVQDFGKEEEPYASPPPQLERNTASSKYRIKNLNRFKVAFPQREYYRTEEQDGLGGRMTTDRMDERFTDSPNEKFNYEIANDKMTNEESISQYSPIKLYPVKPVAAYTKSLFKTSPVDNNNEFPATFIHTFTFPIFEKAYPYKESATRSSTKTQDHETNWLLDNNFPNNYPRKSELSTENFMSKSRYFTDQVSNKYLTNPQIYRENTPTSSSYSDKNIIDYFLTQASKRKFKEQEEITPKSFHYLGNEADPIFRDGAKGTMSDMISSTEHFKNKNDQEILEISDGLLHFTTKPSTFKRVSTSRIRGLPQIDEDLHKIPTSDNKGTLIEMTTERDKQDSEHEGSEETPMEGNYEKLRESGSHPLENKGKVGTFPPRIDQDRSWTERNQFQFENNKSISFQRENISKINVTDNIAIKLNKTQTGNDGDKNPFVSSKSPISSSKNIPDEGFYMSTRYTFISNSTRTFQFTISDRRNISEEACKPMTTINMMDGNTSTECASKFPFQPNNISPNDTTKTTWKPINSGMDSETSTECASKFPFQTSNFSLNDTTKTTWKPINSGMDSDTTTECMSRIPFQPSNFSSNDTTKTTWKPFSSGMDSETTTECTSRFPFQPSNFSLIDTTKTSWKPNNSGMDSDMSTECTSRSPFQPSSFSPIGMIKTSWKPINSGMDNDKYLLSSKTDNACTTVDKCATTELAKTTCKVTDKSPSFPNKNNPEWKDWIPLKVSKSTTLAKFTPSEPNFRNNTPQECVTSSINRDTKSTEIGTGRAPSSERVWGQYFWDGTNAPTESTPSETDLSGTTIEQSTKLGLINQNSYQKIPLFDMIMDKKIIEMENLYKNITRENITDFISSEPIFIATEFLGGEQTTKRINILQNLVRDFSTYDNSTKEAMPIDEDLDIGPSDENISLFHKLLNQSSGVISPVLHENEKDNGFASVQLSVVKIVQKLSHKKPPKERFLGIPYFIQRNSINTHPIRYDKIDLYNGFNRENCQKEAVYGDAELEKEDKQQSSVKKNKICSKQNNQIQQGSSDYEKDFSINFDEERAHQGNEGFVWKDQIQSIIDKNSNRFPVEKVVEKANNDSLNELDDIINKNLCHLDIDRLALMKYLAKESENSLHNQRHPLEGFRKTNGKREAEKRILEKKMGSRELEYILQQNLPTLPLNKDMFINYIVTGLKKTTVRPYDDKFPRYSKVNIQSIIDKNIKRPLSGKSRIEQRMKRPIGAHQQRWRNIPQNNSKEVLH